tara:strand:+ start:444 stop:905 length:462 start_codon:yes stop_codon:yes gene_type:complete
MEKIMAKNNIVNKCFDNTKDGVPNYAIDLIDGRRLYLRGTVLNPMPKNGDAINFDETNTRTSANGNPYTNIENLKIANSNNNMEANNSNIEVNNQNSKPIQSSNLSKNDTQRMDIFVTGVVGRSMGSGHFSVDDINDLTKNAVKSFNENLKEL